MDSKNKVTNNKYFEDNLSRFLATVALFTALFAIIIGVAAYNKADGDIIAKANYSMTIIQNIKKARSDAAASLKIIETRFTKGESFEDIKHDWLKLKDNLIAAYESGGVEYDEDFKLLKENLGNLEIKLSQNSSESTDLLDSMINDLNKNIIY